MQQLHSTVRLARRVILALSIVKAVFVLHCKIRQMAIFLRLVLVLPLLLIGPVATLAHTSDAKLVNATVIGLGGLGRDFEFLDDRGKLRQLSDLNGDVLAVFFGFTNCPDVCPGFLAKANVVSELLGEQRDRFKVVFVTVDSARDTRQVLEAYLKLFGANIIGARIPNGGITQLTADFGISSQVVTDSDGQITISHSVGAFLIDPKGVARVYLSGSKDANEIYTEVKQLLEES